ncbi:MAG: hydrogenase 3 maturation endopeptidase HyCI [Caldisphaeraceae archaeon]|nr:hydrogenase 3 maturation endopeptidase HyCI [Caldisphaeraceae archaeon]
MDDFLGYFKDIISGSKRRIVFCCIGNNLRGDDVFGVIVSKELERRLKDNDNVLIINCEETPELYTDKIASFNPDTIVLIDAVNFGGKIGDLLVTDNFKAIQRGLFSTHNLPLSILENYLRERTNAHIFLVGAQPQNISFFSTPSKEILNRARQLGETLAWLLSKASAQPC